MDRKRKRAFKIIIFFLFFSFLIIFPIVLFEKYHLSVNIFPINIGFVRGGSNKIINPEISRPTLDYVNKKLIDKNLEFAALRQDDDLILFNLKNGPSVIFSLGKDLNWQIEALKNMMLKFSGEAKKPVKIDFEFDMPLVNF